MLRSLNYISCLSNQLALCLLASLISGQTAEATSLPALLQKSKTNSPAIKQAQSNYQSKLAEVGAVDEAFLPEIFSKITIGSDKRETASPFGGDKTKIQAYELGVRKQFQTGTQVELSATRDRARIIYPASVPSQFQTRFNPAFVDAATLSIRQPILRNYMAREIRYRKLALKGVAQAERAMADVQSQVQLAQTEHYFWNVMALYERRSVLKQMLGTAKEFSRLMQKRTRIGRSDFVDEVAAQSEVIKVENQLLSLNIEIEALSQRLASHVGVLSSDIVYRSGELQAPYEENYKSAAVDSLMAKAMKGRKDLEATKSSLAPLESQMKLASEKLKPQLNLFASYSSTGLDTIGSKSVGKVTDFDHPNWALGLEFNYKIGKKAAHADRASARARLAATGFQVESITAEIKRDIRIAKQRLELSEKSLKQAKLQLATLAKKKRAEQQRVRQAKSEKIAVLGFRLEELAAKNNLIQAWLSQKTSIADLKLALHSF